MPNCTNCSAPLPPHSQICSYCKTRNEIDLKGIHDYSVETAESERVCPRCDTPMQVISVKCKKKFYIEQCSHCFGLFFDPGELEYLLDYSVSHVYSINFKSLISIRNLQQHQDYPLQYIKCPVCRRLMNRVNFGARSGVIVDTCRDHGLWLDGGELKQLLEWVKAGGRLYHQEKEEQAKKMEDHRKKIEQNVNTPKEFELQSTGSWTRQSGESKVDLLSLLIRFVTRILF